MATPRQPDGDSDDGHRNERIKRESAGDCSEVRGNKRVKIEDESVPAAQGVVPARADDQSVPRSAAGRADDDIIVARGKPTAFLIRDGFELFYGTLGLRPWIYHRMRLGMYMDFLSRDEATEAQKSIRRYIGEIRERVNYYLTRTSPNELPVQARDFASIARHIDTLGDDELQTLRSSFDAQVPQHLPNREHHLHFYAMQAHAFWCYTLDSIRVERKPRPY